MKFNETPMFITDDAGDRVKVILNIEDFYDLLAAADLKQGVVEENSNSVAATNPPEEEPAVPQPTPSPATEEKVLVAQISADATEDEEQEQPSKNQRRSHEEVFAKAFDLVKSKR